MQPFFTVLSSEAFEQTALLPENLADERALLPGRTVGSKQQHQDWALGGDACVLASAKLDCLITALVVYNDKCGGKK